MSIPEILTLPTWMLQEHSIATPTPRSRRELAYVQFEHAFDTLMEAIAGGATLANALNEYPIPLDKGLFIGWVNSNPNRRLAYKEAKEQRTEEWASRIVSTAEGTDNPLEDVVRSKLKIDTYKWLMGADNRKTYGETKQIDLTGTISVSNALEQARSRLHSIPMEAIEDATFEDSSDGTTTGE